MNRSGTLLAGPYVGEFGWELCAWVPRVRKLSREFARTVVLAPASSAPLYVDFASRVVPVRAAPGSSNFVLGDLVGVPPTIEAEMRVYPTRELVRLEQLGFRMPAMRHTLNSAKEWRRYGEPGPLELDVCLALRPPKRYRGTIEPRRAYRAELAHDLGLRLAAEGLRVAAVGGPDNRTVPGAIDLRGAPLAAQMTALARAGVTVGPSSGPLHLAQLCGCAIVTWYDSTPQARAESRARYAGAWNPFAAPLIYLDEVPSPAQVTAAVLALLCERQVGAAPPERSGAVLTP